MPSSPLSAIEHIVVLMLENRSFDSLLGFLYDPRNKNAPFNGLPPANFEGAYGKDLSNPAPPPQKGRIPVARGFVPTNPNPDPGEPYQDVYCQVFGVPGAPPALGAVPPEPSTPADMQGFVYNYAAQAEVQHDGTDPRSIMNCLTPDTVPVLSSLAYYYGVCDHWFSSVPTQTLCNRSFVAAGTSSGYVNNEGGDGILFVNDTPTIFNLLEAAGQTWKIYCNSWLIESNALLTQKQVWPYFLTGDHFAHFDDPWLHWDDFIAATRTKGGLPRYSFIEPVYIDSLVWGPENDMHPESWPFDLYGPSNVEHGERLLYTLYQPVRSSPDWDKILLIILFDEHGGCYDHVVPPGKQNPFGCDLAISPDGIVIPPSQGGGSGFNFDRLGVRVPAIVVSAYTEQQTILNTCFDHTSVLSTVVNCFSLPTGQLGRRQGISPDVSAALNLPRPRTDQPPIPEPIEGARRAGDMGRAGRFLLQARSKKLSALQRQMLHGVVRLSRSPEFGAGPADIARSAGLRAEVAAIDNALDAETFLMKREAEMYERRLRARGLNIRP